MKKKHLIYFFIFTLSCTNKNSNNQTTQESGFSEKQIKLLKTFDVSKNISKEILISDFNISLPTNIFKDIEFIKLETTRESLIGDIDKIFVLENKILILDKRLSKNLFVFSLDGKFITKVKGIGEGPNEIKNFTDFCINFQKKEIIIFDEFLKKIVFYDYNLVPKKEKTILYRFSNMRLLSNDKLLLSVNMLENDQFPQIDNHGLLLVDSNFNVIKKGFEHTEDEEKNDYALRDHLHQYGNSNIIWSPKYKNAVFEINNEEKIIQKFHLNFSTNEVPNQYYSRSNEDMFKVVKEKNLYYYLGNYEENKDMIFLSIATDFSKPSIHIYYDKKEKKYAYGKMDKIILENPSNPYSPIGFYNDNFISFVDSEYLESIKKDNPKRFIFSEKLKKIMSITKEGDNPIIQFYKISLKNVRTN